ncbi:hypothetical protein SynPROSU1_00101 [Synechococcus sp. PROS-U-1]|nr:hypothetical protein SynPROSU1_00101 [Synechococcus sp. PROS-U-1]
MVSKYKDSLLKNGFSERFISKVFSKSILCSQGGFPLKKISNCDQYTFNGNFRHFGHIAFLLNYARLKEKNQHELILTQEEYNFCKNYIHDVLPLNIELHIRENACQTSLHRSSPDVLNHIDENVLNHFYKRQSQMYCPPNGYVHNYINNQYKYKINEDPMPYCKELHAKYGKNYVVLHLRKARQDNHNRNFGDESVVQPAIDYLNKLGINVIQIGKSDNKLTGSNLIVNDAFSSLYDASIMKNCLAYIGSSSGPSCWAEYLKKPALILDMSVPLTLLSVHVSSNCYILPKILPDNSIGSLFNNLTDLQETGLLWWTKRNANLNTRDLPTDLYTCSHTRCNRSEVIHNAIKYFVDTVLLGHQKKNDKHISVNYFLEITGLDSSAVMLNPNNLQ